MFYDVSDLKTEEIFLKLVKTCDAQAEKRWVPAYYFDICLLMEQRSGIAICGSVIMTRLILEGT